MFNEKLLWSKFHERGGKIHSAREAPLGNAYFSFFFGRSWLVWPQIFLRQLVARTGRRA